MGKHIDLTRYRVRPGTITEAKDVDLDETVVTVDGKRYTEADAEADAIALEGRHRGLVPGGKSLSGGKKHSPVLRTVVPEETFDRVQVAAKEQGVSVSKWLRQLINEKVS
ncbi:MAG: hypothetical protein WAS54_08225 [Scrofimicrobium sp.]